MNSKISKEKKKIIEVILSENKEIALVMMNSFEIDKQSIIDYLKNKKTKTNSIKDKSIKYLEKLDEIIDKINQDY
jgi:hypothetical protein